MPFLASASLLAFGSLSVALQGLRHSRLKFSDGTKPSFLARLISQQSANGNEFAVLSSNVQSGLFFGFLDVSVRNEPCKICKILLEKVQQACIVGLLTQEVHPDLTGTHYRTKIPASCIVGTPSKDHGIGPELRQYIVSREFVSEPVQSLRHAREFSL